MLKNDAYYFLQLTPSTLGHKLINHSYYLDGSKIIAF